MSFFLNNRDLAGILREQVLEGPRHVVIDITNRCNTNCLACWTYSPLLKKENRPDKDWYKQSLTLEILLNLVDDLAQMGVQRIRFTGGGEPLLFKDLAPVLARIREHKIWCAITTNGLLLDEKTCAMILKHQVDEIAISLWAASEGVYRKLHPSAREGQFYQILKSVQTLRSHQNSPRLSFLNVINRHNLHEISRMGDLARNLGVHSVYFTLVDAMPDTVDLVLSDSMRSQASEEVTRLRNRIYNMRQELEWDNLSGFEARLLGAKSDIEYDRERIDSMPCYMGWHFCRILADGRVAPCCKGVDYTMGNLHQSRFRDIWVSNDYLKFRRHAYYDAKSHTYFQKMNCYQMCDNLMHNEEIHQRLQSLTQEQKQVLLNEPAPVIQDIK